MTLSDGAVLTFAAVLGGALNAVAGGGSFFTFPALVFVGIPTVPANATSAVALWPGSLASAAAYRRELAGTESQLPVLAVSSTVGGIGGALLLVWTPSSVFDLIVPFLMFGATLLFALGPRLTTWLGGEHASTRSPVAHAVGQGVIAVYGGYFGGGMGMMMLAVYALLGMHDIHRMNGIKVVMAVLINGAAIVTFILAGIVEWRPALLMMAGAVVGGYGGAAISRRADATHVRRFIILSGLVLSALFFVRAFGR